MPWDMSSRKLKQLEGGMCELVQQTGLPLDRHSKFSFVQRAS